VWLARDAGEQGRRLRHGDPPHTHTCPHQRWRRAATRDGPSVSAAAMRRRRPGPRRPRQRARRKRRPATGCVGECAAYPLVAALGARCAAPPPSLMASRAGSAFEPGAALVEERGGGGRRRPRRVGGAPRWPRQAAGAAAEAGRRPRSDREQGIKRRIKRRSLAVRGLGRGGSRLAIFTHWLYSLIN
jgi:hypothetical protein